MSNRWNPEDYAKNASFVPALGAAVVDLLAPRAGERILDLGCGDGVLTLDLIKAGATVIAVDASADMVAAARSRGVDARVMRGEALTFTHEMDAVFSNAALHWMTDMHATADGVRRALVPGGRFVGEMGGHGNVAHVRRILTDELHARGLPPRPPAQWYPSVEELTAVYAKAGFVDIAAELFPRPTPLPHGVTGWLKTFRAGFLDHVDDATADAVGRVVEQRLEPYYKQPDGTWVMDYVRLRFSMRVASH